MELRGFKPTVGSLLNNNSNQCVLLVCKNVFFWPEDSERNWSTIYNTVKYADVSYFNPMISINTHL